MNVVTCINGCQAGTSSRTYSYVYNYTDHLGNVRTSYAWDEKESKLKILEDTHYYPFGLKHEGYVGNQQVIIGVDEYESQNKTTITAKAIANPITETTGSASYNYKYNGKELQEELGLNVYAMDMRQYDPAIARWVVQDPVVHHSMSPYNAFDNNPVYWADPSGADADNNTDLLGRDRYDQNGMFIPPNERGSENLDNVKSVSTNDPTPTKSFWQTVKCWFGNCKSNKESGVSVGNALLESVIVAGSIIYQIDPDGATFENHLEDGLAEGAHLGQAGVYAYHMTKSEMGGSFYNIIPVRAQTKTPAAKVRGFGSIKYSLSTALKPSSSRGYTEAGYQLSKHAGRLQTGNAELWKKHLISGAINPQNWNQAGLKMFKEIWKAPGSFKRIDGFIEKRLPNGMGIRFQENWKFKGFID